MPSGGSTHTHPMSKSFTLHVPKKWEPPAFFASASPDDLAVVLEGAAALIPLATKVVCSHQESTEALRLEAMHEAVKSAVACVKDDARERLAGERDAAQAALAEARAAGHALASPAQEDGHGRASGAPGYPRVRRAPARAAFRRRRVPGGRVPEVPDAAFARRVRRLRQTLTPRKRRGTRSGFVRTHT